MLPDAEERSATSNFTAWLEKLKDALYDADNLPDELSFDDLRRLLFPWSRGNNYVHLPKMSSQIQVIKNRLTSPERVFDMLNFFDHLLAAKSTTLVAGCPTRMKTTAKVSLWQIKIIKLVEAMNHVDELFLLLFVNHIDPTCKLSLTNEFLCFSCCTLRRRRPFLCLLFTDIDT
ncbi:hypothetical protein ES319_D11G380000v1 [Gossypium barbadense]|uniref:Rx N-terminal domain-containing protein n=1 Tax=Gossypium barbadense TaxID=3634 RepID=A0A5J5PK44_GOSBA|nr:hypothetical protein ES319_D11G380000v1 [Gossypium barbadense]